MEPFWFGDVRTFPLETTQPAGVINYQGFLNLGQKLFLALAFRLFRGVRTSTGNAAVVVNSGITHALKRQVASRVENASCGLGGGPPSGFSRSVSSPEQVQRVTLQETLKARTARSLILQVYSWGRLVVILPGEQYVRLPARSD